MLRREVLKWLSWKFFDPLIKDVPNKFFHLVFQKKKKLCEIQMFYFLIFPRNTCVFSYRSVGLLNDQICFFVYTNTISRLVK